ncbi:metal ABC transporter permease [Actinomarinicola tropica]|uniref:Metal ABC transporter permease n=2 Tax=Actinomarinicola tropica TaxID=2789776 RepID=A0A5Q2RPU7_9ACTN|nr:metal ABC transporter permease [Actinomarinicola tropica]
MQRALLAGVLAVVTTSLVGTWVVIRGMTFIGDALAHGVLPGIALAFVWGLDLRLGAMVSALAMVGGVGLVNRRARLPEDAGIGLLFVGMLALGVIIVSRQRSYSGELSSFLFGDILGVTRGDLVVQGLVALGVLAAVVGGFRAFLALSFNADTAAVLGLHPRASHLAMLGLVAVAVVASFQAVGTLLVFGLLVAPPATASLLVRRVPAMMLVGVLVGVASVYVGLVVSYHHGTAAEATVAFTSVSTFFVVLAGREAVVAARRGAATSAAPG